MKTPRRSVVVLLFLVSAGTALVAQRPDPPTSRLFPDPPRVLADYPDDPSRWAALTSLYFATQERSPDGQYKASYAKSSAYFQAIGLLEAKHHVGTPQEEAEFVSRIRALRLDRDHTRSVLERYHLAALPTASAQSPGTSGTASTGSPTTRPSPEVELQNAFPIWMLTIGVMWLIARQIVHRPMHYPIVQDQPNASLVLPDAIRIVDAFGCRYGLEADSGVVTEEKTWTETTHTTYTTPGSVQTVGDAVYSFPGRQETYSHTVQKDRLWLRDSSGHEAVWVITGGVFSVRVGHVVSRVGTRSGEAVDFIVACNQTTGQCVVFNGPIGRYHGGSSRGALVWPVFVGIAGWVYGGWRLIPLLGIEPFPMALLSFSILGAIGSVIIAFVLNSRIHRKLFLKRNAYFAQKYLPAIRQFLKDQSPAILARFGSAPSRA